MRLQRAIGIATRVFQTAKHISVAAMRRRVGRP